MRLGASLVLAVAACASPAPMSLRDAAAELPSPPRDVSARVVELATGARTWQELPRDGTGRAEVVLGPQGGYHVFGRVRLHGLAPDVTLRFRVTSADGARILTDDRDTIRRVTGRGLLAVGDGTFESTSGELVILQIRSPAEVVGQRWRMEVQVMPADQSAPVTAECAFTIVDDEP